MEIDIGQKLKRIRTRHSALSQRQLARESGVANATISQIEAGKLNPTVSMLKKGSGRHSDQPRRVLRRPDRSRLTGYFFKRDELTEIADGGVSYRQVGANLADRSDPVPARTLPARGRNRSPCNYA